MILQSILIPKKYGMTAAKKWIKKNSYKLEHRNKKPELIKNYYHFRQADKPKGVKYVVKKISDKIFVFHF